MFSLADLKVGLSFASAMGGFLAMPEGRIPIFGDMQIFQKKPFLLPSLAAAVTYVRLRFGPDARRPFVAFPLALRWLPEVGDSELSAVLTLRPGQGVKQESKRKRALDRHLVSHEYFLGPG